MVTQHNFPGTIQLGDVKEIHAKNLPQIDLLIGGSPCQDFSRLNSKRDGLDGSESRLFFEYLRLLKECRPKYFLLENVIMECNQAAIISKLMGIAPVNINAERIGPVYRDRLYWTNIPGDGQGLLHSYITQPKRIDITFQSILTNGYTPLKKGVCLVTSDLYGRPALGMWKRYTCNSGFGNNLIFLNKEQYLCLKRNHGKGVVDEKTLVGIRALNKQELHSCHDIPPGYCDTLNHKQTEDVIGDGWHVGVIKHIMKGLL